MGEKRKWLVGQHCLWPQLHEDAGNLQEKVQIGTEEPYWTCKYCTRVHLQFEIMGADQKDPSKYFVRGWQDGKMRAIHGKESRFKPAAPFIPDREFLKNL